MLKMNKYPNVNFKYVKRRKLNAEVNKINTILGKIKTTDITATNRLVIACTRLVAERLGLRERVKKKRETPRWKRRLENDVAELRWSLSRLEQKEKGELRDDVRLARVQRKYKVQQKGIRVVIEELKQRIVAKSEQIKRYSNRNEQYQINRMFVNSQARVYQELDGNTNGHLVPEANESSEFWGGIWGVAAEHNKEAEWLDHVRESLGGDTHTMVTISLEKIRLNLERCLTGRPLAWKVEKYQDLKREMARLWKLKSVVIVPVVIGALGTISHRCRGVSWKGQYNKPDRITAKGMPLGNGANFKESNGHLRPREVA